MSASMVLWLALAIGTFWAVGVHNRLMRMRARATDALGSVEKHLRQYADLITTYASTLVNSEAQTQAEPSEWLNIRVSLDVLDQAIRDVRRNPLDIQTMARLTAAFHCLQLRWSELENAPKEWRTPALPTTLQQQWAVITERVLLERSALNQILLRYNQALAQFPARAIVGVLGFRSAGLL